MSTFNKCALFLAAIVVLGSTPFASAALVPVINPSFESDAIPYYRDYTSVALPLAAEGWTVASGWGDYNMNDAGMAPTIDGPVVSPQRFALGIPDGTQALSKDVYVTPNAYSPTDYQLVDTATFQADTTYTITGWFGFVDAAGYATGDGGGKISLHSSSDSMETFFAEIDFAPGTTPAGGFQYGSASFSTTDGFWAVGGNVFVRLQATGSSSTHGYAAFDNIRVYEGPVPDAVTWTGAGGTTWSTATGLNTWTKTVGGGTADYAVNADVVFNDSAAGTTVDISGEDVAPASVTFNNSSKNFVLQGSNGIADAYVGAYSSLSKSGTGTLTINNTNSFAGPVIIKGGKISVGTVADSGVNSPLGAGNRVAMIGGGLQYTAPPQAQIAAFCSKPSVTPPARVVARSK